MGIGIYPPLLPKRFMMISPLWSATMEGISRREHRNIHIGLTLLMTHSLPNAAQRLPLY